MINEASKVTATESQVVASLDSFFLNQPPRTHPVTITSETLGGPGQGSLLQTKPGPQERGRAPGFVSLMSPDCVSGTAQEGSQTG